MARIQIRDRNQLTVPVDIAKAAGIGPGSVCEVDYRNGVITLTPADHPWSRQLAEFYGAARGAWGETDEEIEQHLSSDRDSWNR